MVHRGLSAGRNVRDKNATATAAGKAVMCDGMQYAHPNGEMHYNVKDENGLDKCDRAIGVWSAEARAYHRFDDLPPGDEGEPGIPETPQDTQETAPAVIPVSWSTPEDASYGPTSLTLREGLSYERWQEK